MFGFTKNLILPFLLLMCTAAFGQTGANAVSGDSFSEGNSPLAILKLTANECFFGPTGNLKCVEDVTARGSGSDFNKKYVFTHITNWSSTGDTVVWGVNIFRTGAIFFSPVLGVPASQAQSQIELVLQRGNSTAIDTLTLKSTCGYSVFGEQDRLQFNIPEAGLYIFKLRIVNKNAGGNIADIREILVNGPAAKTAEVIQRRWRPLAAHTRWSCSGNPSKVKISVHENTIITTGVDMYQPITTPFGYTGSTWDPKSQTFKVFNFSLWSFSANSSSPPVEQLSHLIAVGKGLSFGNFSHEGTGVKPRGPSPYLGVKTNKQTIAIRMEPGITYNTFYVYYLNPKTGHWSFYGCGRTFNKKNKIEYLSTGAFIEVVGAPATARSGHRLREVHYRGWQMNEDGNWFTIDKMLREANDSKLSYKNFGVTADGKFLMQMGGLKSKVTDSGTISRSDSSALPDYLQSGMLNELYNLPAEFTALTPDSIGSTSAELVFDIKKIGTQHITTLYYGAEEGLTFYELWQNSQTVNFTEGINKIKLTGLLPDTKYFYRLRIVNSDGIAWLMDTHTFTTTVTNIDLESDQPRKFGLRQNYPNPFNPSTNIEFNIPEKSNVVIKIYNSAGQFIDTLINKKLSAGSYSLKWDGVNYKGEKVAQGVYIYSLSAAGYSTSKKMILLK